MNVVDATFCTNSHVSRIIENKEHFDTKPRMMTQKNKRKITLTLFLIIFVTKNQPVVFIIEDEQ